MVTINRKKMLNALEQGEQHYPSKWTVKGYNLLKHAITKGKIIDYKDIIGIGHPMSGHIFGEEHFYFLKTKYKGQDFIVEILKDTAYKDSIGFSGFRTKKKGSKWEVIEG